MIFRMPQEPAFHRRCLVSPVVVQNHMNFDSGFAFQFRIQFVEEFEELLMPVSPVTLADHLAGRHVESREQRGCAVADEFDVDSVTSNMQMPQGQQGGRRGGPVD